MARIKPSHLLVGILGIVLIVGTFLIVLPELASYGSVIAQFQSLSFIVLLLLAVLAVLNVLSFAPPLQVALPGLVFLARTFVIASRCRFFACPTSR